MRFHNFSKCMVNSAYLNPARRSSVLILVLLLYIFVNLQILCSPIHLHFKQLQDALLTLHSRIFCPNSPAPPLKESDSGFSSETVKSIQDSYVCFTTLPNHVHCSTYFTVKTTHSSCGSAELTQFPAFAHLLPKSLGIVTLNSISTGTISTPPFPSTDAWLYPVTESVSKLTNGSPLTNSDTES